MEGVIVLLADEVKSQRRQSAKFFLPSSELAREGLGESQFRRGDIHCGTLYIYILQG